MGHAGSEALAGGHAYRSSRARKERMPYRIQTTRLVLRPYAPADAPEVQRALARNKSHLLPWMPWAAREPSSVEEKLAWILTARARFDLGQDFLIGLFHAASGELLGGSGLHPRVGPDAAEIGYWIDREHTGIGLASEAVSALLRVGFENLALARIEIRCDPANEKSARIPRRLGFQEDGRLRAQIPMPDGSRRDTLVFSLLKQEFFAGPSTQISIERFDALDRPIEAPELSSPNSEVKTR